MDLYVELLASSIRMSVPLILACIAGLWSERAGIVDIGLEGKMLIAAFVAASASAVFGSAWIGLFFAILASTGLALVHGYAAISQRGNQVVSGVAINMLAAGLAVVLGNEWFREGGRTPALPPDARFLPFSFPALADLPVIGALSKIVLSVPPTSSGAQPSADHTNSSARTLGGGPARVRSCSKVIAANSTFSCSGVLVTAV